MGLENPPRLTENLGDIEREREEILKRTDDEHIVAVVDSSYFSARALNKVFPK